MHKFATGAPASSAARGALHDYGRTIVRSASDRPPDWSGVRFALSARQDRGANTPLTGVRSSRCTRGKRAVPFVVCHGRHGSVGCLA